ncbi:MAG: hypothetical protein IJQ31_13460 [Thermoguttaceae bacterium]|nr:hypothetical protein [Thermoguttaceae bacterium]
MIIMPNFPGKPMKPETFSPIWTLVSPSFMPLPDSDSTLENDEDAPENKPAQEEIFSFPNFYPQTSGNVLTLTDMPPLIVTNSYDDDNDKDNDNDNDDDNIEDIPDEEDDDVFEEVETFEDFDDDFDEDFEDEFDEDYEELARIDDEDIEDEDEDSASTPSRYEEEFGDVDGQIKFIPDGGDMPLNEEVLMIEDDLDDSDASDFDDYTDDDSDDFGEYDNDI